MRLQTRLGLGAMCRDSSHYQGYSHSVASASISPGHVTAPLTEQGGAGGILFLPGLGLDSRASPLLPKEHLLSFTLSAGRSSASSLLGVFPGQLIPQFRPGRTWRPFLNRGTARCPLSPLLLSQHLFQEAFSFPWLSDSGTDSTGDITFIVSLLCPRYMWILWKQEHTAPSTAT